MSHAIPLTDPLSIEWIEYQRAEHVPTNTIARRVSVLRSLPHASHLISPVSWWNT